MRPGLSTGLPIYSYFDIVCNYVFSKISIISCNITSYCVINKIDEIKINGISQISQNDFLELAGNKSVFTPQELTKTYNTKQNVVIIEMTYNGFFGRGHNVTHKNLKDAGLWFDKHPYEFKYTRRQFLNILEMGGKDVQNVIIN